MTPISDFLIRIYRMESDQTNEIQGLILETMSTAWRRGVSDEAHAFGCKKFGKPPAGEHLEELKTLARTDAMSITNTFNRDLVSFIEALVAANPDEQSATFFGKQIRSWIARRNQWKNPQIALNSETRGRELGRKRFWQRNNITALYQLKGAPPVCPVCLKTMAMGSVPLAYTEAHPAPLHINCVHYWQPVNASPRQLNCSTIWLG